MARHAIDALHVRVVVSVATVIKYTRPGPIEERQDDKTELPSGPK